MECEKETIMNCVYCRVKIKEGKKFCSLSCVNDKRRYDKIERNMQKTTHLLSCDISNFIKTLINDKTGRLEPNKMKPQYFNNNYILPIYCEILKKTKKYKTLTFKDRVYILLNNIDGNRSMNDLVNEILKSNGGIDFNKITLRWLEMNGFLNISSTVLNIDKENLEEYLFLLNHDKQSCRTCGNTTTFNGYSKGYNDYCSIACVSNNTEIKNKKNIHRNEKKIASLFNLKHIKPMFGMITYKGADQGLKYEFECNRCFMKFKSRISNGHIPICPKCDYKHFNGNSNMENELIQYISKNNKIETSNRTILNGKELDIVIPDKKIAIEFNGIYWHSELNGKNRQYHLDKTIQCAKKDIQLIHIFESEWIEKKNIVLSVLNAKLGSFCNVIFARKCVIREILSKTKNKFLIENHLQGQDKSSIRLGLFYDDELVAVMTFGKSRYNKKYQYEMHRFCNKLNHRIIGGASKLWSYFIRKYQPNTVITYADRRYSVGSLYEKIGFKKINESQPNYFYLERGKSTLISRIKFQKHKLKNELTIFDESLTEWENMQVNGYDRIWDCGNYVFGWEYLKKE